ncbi:chemotaxis protein CheD [Lentibacillus sp. JNUCC-1]|uniref:chemotaxis protein CheD n=1 Tax=Lentibacillus sp. JNUCC-1 TaxID=2654513 RepID=UPI0012E91128|nr:chemotaxis protein CheD [Lentibacillus sp. JNUCC-1]
MNEPKPVVRVGIAELKIVKSPNMIRTSGLGSCVGVVIYDLSQKTAGLAHIMLPDSSLAKQADLNTSKYADTAIDVLVKKLTSKGKRPSVLKAKIAGGAEMFQFSTSNESMRIGPRNTAAVKEKLAQYGIRIMSEDVGGNSGRTIEFDPETGRLHIRTVHKGETII